MVLAGLGVGAAFVFGDLGATVANTGAGVREAGRVGVRALVLSEHTSCVFEPSRV